MPEARNATTIGLEKLQRSTGLSLLQCKAAVNWLIRKGLLQSTGGETFPQRGARFRLDSDLFDAFAEMQVPRFGSLADKVIATGTADGNPIRMAVLTLLDGQTVGDEYENPLPLSEALMLRDHLDRHIQNIESSGPNQIEKHWRSRYLLRNFGQNNLRYGMPSSFLPARICECDQCKLDYERAFRAKRNYKSQTKEDRKSIREAMKEIA